MAKTSVCASALLTIIFAALVQGSQALDVTPEFVQVIYHVQVNGSTRLPDPALLNAFLEFQNDQSDPGLFNPLYPHHPRV